MPENFSAKLLAFLAGLISAAFGAGITFAAWQADHPTKKDIAFALGCSAYSNTLEGCTAAADAKAARQEIMSLREDIKGMRKDLSTGFGRSLATSINLRDESGKRAVRMFENEIRIGVTPVDALRHVLESDFP